MEAKALELIQNTAIEAAKANRLDTAIPAVIVSNTSQLIDLEKSQLGRSRFRGVYETASISDYIGHVITNATAKPGTHLFINPEYFGATAIYNYGSNTSPGHCDDLGVLDLDESAGYVALKAINGKRQTQKQIIEFIEDWNQNITPFDSDDNDTSLAGAVAAIREITISSKSDQTSTVGDLKQSVSAYDEIEAKAKGIPAGFLFNCVPYIGLPAANFKLRLSILTTEKDPVIMLRIVGFEQQKEDIAQGFKKILIDGIGNVVKAYIGTFKPR